jgi:hypothetical protein
VNVRRRLTTAAVALALPVLTARLSGCGFDAPTDQRYNPAVGVNVQGGEVDALNVLIVSGSEGKGALVATFANNNQSEGDSLVDATGKGVQVELGGDTEIPAGGILTIDDGSATVTGDRVVAGNFVPLTFSFENASSVTLQAPVVEPTGPFEDLPLP